MLVAVSAIVILTLICVLCISLFLCFFFSSRRRHTRCLSDWSSDVCSSDLLIVISHDRHFLNSVCTHVADIDYETVIMYTGGYDDMVLAKTQIRSRIEAQNQQREKKIAQLNEFIARFSAGTRSSQVTSRKKEVERLQTSDLARSNIARPYIKFEMKRPSGRHPLEIKALTKSYDGRLDRKSTRLN